MENIEVVNKVLAGIKNYDKTKKLSREGFQNFILEKWSDYREIFPSFEYDNPQVQEWGIKLIMFKVLFGNYQINQMLKETNLQ